MELTRRGRYGLTPLLFVSNILIWISAVIVMGILSYFISVNNNQGSHIIYEEVVVCSPRPRCCLPTVTVPRWHYHDSPCSQLYFSFLPFLSAPTQVTCWLSTSFFHIFGSWPLHLPPMISHTRIVRWRKPWRHLASLHCMQSSFYIRHICLLTFVQLLLVVQRRARMAPWLRRCPFYLESLMFQMVANSVLSLMVYQECQIVQRSKSFC